MRLPAATYSARTTVEITKSSRVGIKDAVYPQSNYENDITSDRKVRTRLKQKIKRSRKVTIQKEKYALARS